MCAYKHTYSRQCVGENIVAEKDYSKLFIARDSSGPLHLDCLWKSPFHFRCRCQACVTVSRHQPDRGVTRSWAQLVPNHLHSCCTDWPRHRRSCRSSGSRTGSTCPPSLLPGRCISPSSPSLGWHWLEFPQQCSWEMGKSGEVSWLQVGRYRIFCRLQLVPWSSTGRLQCTGAEIKPCQGGVI